MCFLATTLHSWLMKLLHQPTNLNVLRILEAQSDFVAGQEVTSLLWGLVVILRHGSHFISKFCVLPRSFYILKCLPWYMCRSESTSQVFFILLTWLISLMQSSSSLQPRNMYIAYDNICNLCRLHVSRKPLPLSAPFNMMWLELNKIIDMFHLKNHVACCQSKYSP